MATPDQIPIVDGLTTTLSHSACVFAMSSPSPSAHALKAGEASSPLSDIASFVRISGGKGFEKPDDVPLSILVPAFATSELKTAFQIGFLIFIPFLIIDMIVASVLMSLGMMMLSPVLVALPFKLMLFVLADGWNLLLGSLAASFVT